MKVIGPPAANPCGSCPYRREVPSGIWAEEEYAKLPRYDLPTGEQPPSVFLCHQQDGRLCAGWAGCHDMAENLGLRFAVITGAMSQATCEAVLDYETPTPLFASGADAAAHGLTEIARPGASARRVSGKIRRRASARSSPQ